MLLLAFGTLVRPGGPSVVVPSERSYLISPQHEDFERLQIDGPFDPSIDARLS